MTSIRTLRFAALPVLLALLALLLALAVACGDDDDGPPEDTGSPSASAALATAAPTGDGDGGGETAAPTTNAGGETTEPPANGGTTTAPSSFGTGEATIDGVTYEFEVQTCSVSEELAIIVGFGSGGGVPIIGTATWFERHYLGADNAIEVGIGVNQTSALEVGDKVYKLGHAVQGSAVDEYEVDPAAFEVTVSGTFIDVQATDDPPVEGSFTVACRPR